MTHLLWVIDNARLLEEGSSFLVAKWSQNSVTSLIHTRIKVFSLHLSSSSLIITFRKCSALKVDEPIRLRTFTLHARVTRDVVSSILVVIICISAKSIFDKWFVLIIEFIWSDDNRMHCIVFLVNGGTNLIRICDSRTKSILKLFTVPFLNILHLVRTRMGGPWIPRRIYLIRYDNQGSISLLAIQCSA